MKVIFLEDIPSVAQAGETKTVKDGYARNYLLPRKLAVQATPAEMRRVQSIKKAAAVRVAKTEEEHRELAKQISAVTVSFTAKAGEGGRLFGSVTNADVAQKLSEMVGRSIDKRKVEMAEPLKAIGTFELSVKLMPNIEAKVKVVVEAEGGVPVAAGASAVAGQTESEDKSAGS